MTPDVRWTTPALKEFYRLRTVVFHFPLVFQSGYRWETFEGTCNKCGETFPPGDLRGQVTQPFPGCFVLQARGNCWGCAMFTPFHYRLHEDGGITGPDPRTGEWARWEGRRSWSLKRWLQGLFG